MKHLLALLLLVSAANAADKELTFDGKTKAEWVKALKDAKSEDATVAAVTAVGKFAAPDTVPALVATAHGENGKVFAAVADALIAIGPDALPPLLPYLHDDDSGTVLLAGLVITRSGTAGRSAAVPMVHLLGTKQTDAFREEVAAWLVAVHNRDTIPALTDLLTAEDPVARLTAAFVLFHLEAEVKPALAAATAALKELPPRARARAVLNLQPAGAAAVPVLAGLLADREILVRYSAAQALARLGPAATEAADALAKALKDDDEDDRVTVELAEAAWRVARNKAAIPVWKKLLDSKAEGVPVLAAERLWHADRDPKALAALARIAADKASDERDAGTAMNALGVIGPAAADTGPALVPLLDNPVRFLSAAGVLGRFGTASKKSAAKVGKLLADEKSPAGRFLLMQALAEVTGDEAPFKALPELLEKATEADRRQIAPVLVWLALPTKDGLTALRALLQSADPVVRAFAADALVRGGRVPEAVPTLLLLLDSPESQAVRQAVLSCGLCDKQGELAVAKLCGLLWDERFASEVAEALGRIGPDAKDAVPHLIARLRAGGAVPATYSAACEALAEIGPDAKAAVPELKKQLAAPQAYVRVHAARALWKVAADKSGEAVLAAALAHPDHKCRGYAAEALWFLRQEKQAVPLLIRLFDDYGLDRGNQRYIAARALGRLGPAAKEALPLLKGASDDIDPLLADTARRAVQAIEKK